MDRHTQWSGREADDTRTIDLWLRARAGDARAERKVFAEHREQLVRRVRAHRLRDGVLRHCEPEDVAHETLARALRTGLLSRFEDRGRGSLGRLLGEVLDKVMHDILRRQLAIKRGGGRIPDSLNDSDAPRDVADMGSTPTGHARFAELTQLAARLLPPRNEAVWSAVEVGGLSPSEAARCLGMSPAAARALLRRSRLLLMRALDPPPVDGPASLNRG